MCIDEIRACNYAIGRGGNMGYAVRQVGPVATSKQSFRSCLHGQHKGRAASYSMTIRRFTYATGGRKFMTCGSATIMLPFATTIMLFGYSNGALRTLVEDLCCSAYARHRTQYAVDNGTL